MTVLVVGTGTAVTFGVSDREIPCVRLDCRIYQVLAIIRSLVAIAKTVIFMRAMAVRRGDFPADHRGACMATCPECDAEIEVDEFDVDKGDLISCPECGSNLEVTSTSPVELEPADDDDEEEDDDDDREEDDEFDDEDGLDESDEDESDGEDWEE
jgi:alpha-aminoadipate carrier protein LysW